MGWLKDICKIAQSSTIKCTRCGNETVDFVVRESTALIRCQHCGAETEIALSELPQLNQPKKQIEP